ncbi:DUF6443 domain-containing protein [Flavobacterium sp. 20NA77.7]|uniref:DUF6443 domain-containing protein n=1 Tax=Flavobacterium nakdongensis TaxID=3073563 RepID=A0ABY9R6N0_9FLAO|nr:DUF6443 domain-containing protein [Flavobacterium sp. 20NA77.7]WMW76928.1 DUF6443 domain-containing protein [Flavobacterium sp. 20NA77.7]
MKKILYILLSIPIVALAQSPDQNWVKTKVYKQPTGTAYATPSVSQASTQVTYFDGLGRPIQQVAHGQSNTGKDIVTHMEYDAYGRQTKEFLPYASQNTSLNYNGSAATAVYSFYTSYNGGTQNPYAEKLLEASPLSRVFKQAAPGNPWAMGSGREIKFAYQTNLENDVRRLFAKTEWNQDTKLYAISFTDYNFYEANQLYKTITYDENSPGETSNVGRTEEYKDKEGRVVLKRTYNNNDPHETYYVYDVYGNLTYVIPPAVSGTIDQTILDNLCYQYKYDYRNRLVEKKLPGKQWEYIVYDKLDRVVATGPAYNPWGGGDTDKGWMLTKYDVFNRPVYTGWYNGTAVATSQDRNNLQTALDANTNLSESKATATVTIDAVATKYTNTVFPTDFKLLSVTYYDNYDYPNAPTIPSQVEEQSIQGTNLKGLATGTWVRVLDNVSTTTNETSYTLYDTRYRPVRAYTKNFLGGYTQVDTKLDWAGKTLYTLTKHKYYATSTELVTRDRFEYSPQDRITKHVHQINADPEQLLTLNTYDELGQLLSKNIGGTDLTGVQPLQKVDYSYNIRGWLKTINDVNNMGNDLFSFKINYDQKEDESAGLFNGNITETLWKTSADNVKRKYAYSYDDLNRLLNADYSKPGLTSTPNNYAESMSYDKNGNIQTLTRYGDLDSDGMVSANLIDDLKYTYDANNANLLVKVIDLSNSPQGFNETSDINTGDCDGVNDQTDDYSYDANGNMIADANKGISSIIYNHLNLPKKITFEGTTNGEISYLYNALGQKLQKKVVNATTNDVTDYVNGYQYLNTKLEFFVHAEGYVKYTPPTGRGLGIYSYVFNYTDHLGNIRVSYGKDPATNVLKILEENHYYPFGLKHKNYNSDRLAYIKEAEVFKLKPINTIPPTYKYKYNGKELQDELGLNMYDYGARNYDAALGRWMNIDPLAETSRRWSTFTYCYNNPLRYIDPDGMSAADPPSNLNGTSALNKMIWTDSNGTWIRATGEWISLTKGVDNIIDDVVVSPASIENNSSTSTASAALATCWTVSLVEPTPFGELLMTAVTAVAVLTYGDEVLNGMRNMMNGDANNDTSANVNDDDIHIPEENKVDRDSLNPPATPGRAPTFKKDGMPVEIHHEGQNANGPFREMHPEDHRGKGNYRKNHPAGQKPLTKEERAKFNRQRERYWKKEYPDN